jgi:hypothetical protein
MSGVDLSALDGWDIVVAADAIPAERYAAEEFWDAIRRTARTELPIVLTARGTGCHVLIGPGAAGIPAGEFGPEDYRLSAGDDLIVIAGGRPRGTLYGVYAFLEDCLGARFLTARHTHLPRLSEAHVVGPFERTYRPPLSFRWPYYGENVADPEFATRLRVNTVTDDPRLGGRTPIGLISHTFQRHLPSRVYGAEHPEYYALRDGRRMPPFEDDFAKTQPCLSNPDVLRIVTERVLADIEASPGRLNVSVSQNDNMQHCQCQDCRAIDEREGSPMGSLLTFVNAVADEVAKRHPDVKVGTLAYQYSRRPPRHLRPRPNVHIQLCSIECCVTHPIDDPGCPRNVEFCRDLAAWGEVCDDVRVWTYDTNFQDFLLPCPNLRVLEPNLRYFVRHNVRGVFVQVAGNETWARLTPWQAGAIADPTDNVLGAELSELRNYVIAGLLWDPSRSGQALMDEFLDLHYRESAPPIRRFINMLHDNAEARGLHPTCGGRAAAYGIDEEMAQAGLDAYEEALSLAGNDWVYGWVEKASIAAVRAALEPAWYAEAPDQVDPALAERMRPLAQRLFALCKRHGVTHAALNVPIAGPFRRVAAALGLEYD